MNDKVEQQSDEEDIDNFEDLEVVSDTEQEIIKSLGLNDEDDDTQEETATGPSNTVTKTEQVQDETKTEQKAGQEQQEPATEASIAAAVTKPTSEFNLGKSPENEQARRTLGKYANTRLPEDEHGNLIDPQTKEIVAKAGNERFFFEIARNTSGYVQKAVKQLEGMQLDLQQANSKLQAYDALHTETKNAGLSVAEHHEAVKLMKAFKDNPKATLKYMLTEAASNGIDLNEVFGEGSNFQTGAIEALIDKKLAPLTQQQQTQQQIDQINDEAARTAQNFLNRYPDAKVHEPVLAKMLTDNPNLGLVDAYYTLREYASSNGLDWTQPLVEQINKQQQQPAPQQQNPQPQRKPMLSGHNTQTVQVGKQEAQNNSMGATARTDDIVREAMKDAGINF